ncbi:hypothetical protein L6R52_34570 [Myxococcota bacterium]|nr:hypothetical protein [Myxococcota bacterium]
MDASAQPPLALREPRAARVARVLGLVLHPAVPGFFVALYAAIAHEGGLTARLVGVAALVTFACVGIPIASLAIGHLAGGTRDLFGDRRQTRGLYFYPAAGLGLFVAWCIFDRVYPFPLARVMVVAAGGVIVLLALANRRLKASIHVAGDTAIAMAATWTYGLVASPLFLIVPLVAWARVRARKHTLLEVAIGALVGLAATLVALFAVSTPG